MIGRELKKETSGKPAKDGTTHQVSRDTAAGSINQQIPPAYYLA